MCPGVVRRARASKFVRGRPPPSGARGGRAASPRHSFDAIVWNVVRYRPAPLLESSRGTLHLEFDLGIALPIECARIALECGFRGTFTVVTSGLAFGVSHHWGSYSIVKRGQVILAEYLATEAAGRLRPKAIALGTLADVPAPALAEVFLCAMRDSDPEKILYKAYGREWE